MNELSDEVRFLSSRARPLVAPFHMVAVCAPGRVELKSRLFKLFIMNLCNDHDVRQDQLFAA
jgi:hypothetical protein